MNNKMQKYKQIAFSFEFPLNHKVVRNGRIVNEFIGNLLVQGFANKLNGTALDPLDEQFKVDVDWIFWNGTDIQPVLQVTSLHEDIKEAALQHASGLDYRPLTHTSLLTIFANNLTA
jgi:hypothetical protein